MELRIEQHCQFRLSNNLFNNQLENGNLNKNFICIGIFFASGRKIGRLFQNYDAHNNCRHVEIYCVKFQTDF